MSHTSSGQTWDERYGEEGWAFGTEPNDFLREVLPRLPVGDVLVLGDGEGRNGVYLAGCGHRTVTVDLSPVGVAKARALAAERGVEIDARVADLSDFDMGAEQWDAVVSIFCHLPPALRASVHSRVRAALRPGGRFVLESYTAANIGRGVGGPQSSDMTLELAELERDFMGWTLEVHRDVERPVVEGRYHSGLSATVQFVAVKPS
jgi:SAM-dependent methyltransferase